MESFLFNLPLFREKLAQYPRRGNGALLEKLDALLSQYTTGKRRPERISRRLPQAWRKPERG